jgi:uncharacterized protein (TIGR03032 family)
MSEQQPPLSVSASPGFPAWLAAANVSLAFTTYQTNRLFLVGSKPGGRLSVFERLFDRPMGLHATSERLYLSMRWQLWRFDNVLPSGKAYKEYDRLYVPQRAYTTGALDVHDVVVAEDDSIVFVNTGFSCLATLSEKYNFRPIWRPPFITALAPEDRCHLNGLAMEHGKPAYVTAVARTDEAGAWRKERDRGGVLMRVPSGDVVADGLSMPHSPRVYRGKIWMLNSGTGELGFVEPGGGRFQPVTFCPGFLRGLTFFDKYAIVGLSKQRQDRTFQGLALDEKLRDRRVDARCGLWVIDIERGVVAEWLQLEGVVIELYDVQVLDGVRRPMSLGFRNDEIQRFISYDGDDGPVFRPFEIRKRDDATSALPGYSKS